MFAEIKKGKRLLVFQTYICKVKIYSKRTLFEKDFNLLFSNLEILFKVC